MDYVAILTSRASVSASERDGALARRAMWTYPAGISLIAEYWPMSSDVTVVSIFSTDDFAAVMELTLEWNDVFDINVYPAVTWNEGLELGGQIFPRLHRMQP